MQGMSGRDATRVYMRVNGAIPWMTGNVQLRHTRQTVVRDLGSRMLSHRLRKGALRQTLARSWQYSTE